MPLTSFLLGPPRRLPVASLGLAPLHRAHLPPSDPFACSPPTNGLVWLRDLSPYSPPSASCCRLNIDYQAVRLTFLAFTDLTSSGSFPSPVTPTTRRSASASSPSPCLPPFRLLLPPRRLRVSPSSLPAEPAGRLEHVCHRGGIEACQRCSDQLQHLSHLLPFPSSP